MISFVLLCYSGIAQCMSTKEKAELERIVYYFCQNQQIERKIDQGIFKKSSEIIFCLLELDSLGKVSNIRLIGDENNKDSAFAILSRIKVSDFKNWKVENCKQKTVMIPIISLSPTEKPQYVEHFVKPDIFKPGEYGNLIILRKMTFGWIRSKH